MYHGEICISIDDFDDEINIIGDNAGDNLSTKCPETRFKVIEEDEEETLLQTGEGVTRLVPDIMHTIRFLNTFP